ncbi:MAG: hypothetical protein Q7U72_13140 [Brevundimonas sp.]|uniref:hypothetical protein n=1 Tax=Brevundimonas sp. TaxID=1871086 RepID=UPI002723917D|nr:hypothetical protein [Brevundimonas sp.]MDO9078377.1 hypothetical protein [Brevundimonas sp.]MDP3370956.1 hypothetical protein [Brevundimonas sp.]MDZ4059578.1 hypothetical protein [Brevundimonas sp.]
MTKTHRLDLLNNSISYFREAVNHAQLNTDDTDQWKFAIVHVVQAMELAFKEYLRRIHPAFIWESVDRPERTISFKGALARLRNPQIGGVAISDGEKGKIEKAFDLRNELTHFEFNHEHEHIELKFAEIFGFMVFFYRTHLNLETDQFVDEVQHQRILHLVKAREELLAKARDYVRDMPFGEKWICPSCNEVTFVVSEQQCCLCHHKERIVECTTCGRDNFESEIVDTTNLFSWDYSEGQAILMADHGLSHTACSECYGAFKEKLEELNRAQYYEDLMMDERAGR